MGRRYRAGIETHQRITDAIRHLLAEVGLEGTTIKAICERARTRPGSFYNLFDTKAEALLTVIREAIEAVDPDPAGEGVDTIADLIEAYVAFVDGEPTLARIYLQIAVTGGATDPHLRGRVTRHHRRRVERFADAITREQPDLPAADAARKAETLVATLNGLALSSLLDNGLDFRSYAREIAPPGRDRPRAPERTGLSQSPAHASRTTAR
jgi:AcrR family transcriptional regulator